MCDVRRSPMLHFLALGQHQNSCPILYILFGNFKIDGQNTDFIPSVISIQ